MHTLHFKLTTPAVDERPIYVTGNFCNWAMHLDVLQLQPVGDGQYELALPITEQWPDLIEYKYHRAGEGSFELDEQGGLTGNRLIDRNTTQVSDYVAYWQWQYQAINPAMLPIEQTLYLAYPGSPVPRRVQVVLPYDYADSGERYPVLYLNDGQNLIREGAGYGSWLTEFRLAQLATRQQHRVIIVAIDHGEAGRMAEFTIEAVRPGFGQGRVHLDFVVNTLKPLIDATYRTRPDPANTGMGGSSLGGLITVWAGLLYPAVFGRWLVFSPALWISPGVYAAASRQTLPAYCRVYLYGGKAESSYMVPNLKRLQRSLSCATDGCAYLHVAIDPNGLHQEQRWSAELTPALTWLFASADKKSQPQLAAAGVG